MNIKYAFTRTPSSRDGIKKRDATRGLPRRSPILVLLSPKHAELRSSDGIRCFSAGMIAADMFSTTFLLMPSPPAPFSVIQPLGVHPTRNPGLPRHKTTTDRQKQ